MMNRILKKITFVSICFITFSLYSSAKKTIPYADITPQEYQDILDMPHSITRRFSILHVVNRIIESKKVKKAPDKDMPLLSQPGIGLPAGKSIPCNKS